MRTEGTPPMTAAEFEQALADARRGVIQSDMGTTEAVERALDRIARRIPGAIPEARRAFEESTSPGVIN
jgi:hypothetical protein